MGHVLCKQCTSHSCQFFIITIFTIFLTNSNGSERFMQEQIADSFYFRALCGTYRLTVSFIDKYNEIYAISEGHQKALNIDVDLGEEA